MNEPIRHFKNDNPRHYYLYVLRLEGKKFYIGVTSKQPQERFLEHKNGFYGAEWTRLYKPVSIEQTVDLGLTTYSKAEAYENKITRIYIKKYGLNSVRGGNITFRGNIVKRFGYIWRVEDWRDIIYLLVMMVGVTLMTTYIIYDFYFVHGGMLGVRIDSLFSI